MKSSNMLNIETNLFTKNDIILNSYADSIQGNGVSPLKDLHDISSSYLKNIINGIHVLPFYEWDTDRGFSVVNYYEVWIWPVFNI